MIVMRKSESKYDVKNKRKSGNVLWLISLESRSSSFTVHKADLPCQQIQGVANMIVRNNSSTRRLNIHITSSPDASKTPLAPHQSLVRLTFKHKVLYNRPRSAFGQPWILQRYELSLSIATRLQTVDDGSLHVTFVPFYRRRRNS
jgi:hypothetical protein